MEQQYGAKLQTVQPGTVTIKSKFDQGSSFQHTIKTNYKKGLWTTNVDLTNTPLGQDTLSGFNH